MSNSINTNIAAYYAQANITQASNAAASSVARLSSGNRIVEASDDVAALAVGTSLQTTVNSLTTAQTNVSQGSSLLQVADGALAQIQSILQQQQSIALQSASGSLTDTDRSFLNQEFQALSSQIDSLASSTTFNGVQLLNGALSEAAGVNASTSQASAASATIALTSNLVANDKFVINGLTLTAAASPSTAVQFKIGATAADTITNLTNTLNTLAVSNTAVTVAGNATTYAGVLGGAVYASNGTTTLNVSAKTGGTLGDNFTINASGVTGNKATVGGQYGGSTVDLLSSTDTITSATAAIATTGSAATTKSTPFKNGDTISVTIGNSGSAVNLYTVGSGDSLTDIVNGINTNSGTTGVSAVLVSSGSDYNIQLNLHNSSGNVSINGGSHFYNGTDQTVTLNGANSTVNLFSDTAAAYIAGNGASPVAASTATQASPLVAGSNIYVSLGGKTPTALLDSALTSSDTIASIITKINSSAAAGALGIHATSAESGTNIALTYADPAGGTSTPTAISFTSGTSASAATVYNTDALGQNLGNALNGATVSFSLLPTGVNAPNTAIVGASATPETPFANTAALTATIVNAANPTGTTINLATLTTGETLQQIAGAINGATGADSAQSVGMHAEVVQDSAGNYNIQLSYASSAAPLTTDSSYPTGVQLNLDSDNSIYTANSGVYDVSSTLNTGAQAQNATYSLFTSSFAAGLSKGQAVVTSGATTAALPFSSSDTLTAAINGGTAVDLASLSAGDTLADIVNTINGNTSTTNISAALDGNGTNILLSYTGTDVNPKLSFSAGVDAFNDSDLGTTPTNGINNSYSTGNLFATGFTTGSGSTIVSGTSTAIAAASDAIPLTDGDTLSMQIGSGSTFAITGALAASTTLQELVDNINTTATAAANGVHASLITDGSGNENIALTVADTAGTGLAAGAYTIVSTNSGNYDDYTDHALTTGVNSTYTAVNNVLQNSAATTATAFNASSIASVATQANFGLAGGLNNGLGLGSTTVTGSVGDTVLTGLSQNAAQVTISFPDIDATDLTSASNFDSDGSKSISVGGHSFTFVTNATAADQIQIGSTLQQTLDNAVATINSYGQNDATGNTAYQLNQITASRSGNSLVFTGKGISNVTQITGAAASTISTTVASASTPSNSGSLDNSSTASGSTFGVNATGISNAAFTGTISGFTATTTGTANTVDLSVKVGQYTYTADNVNTNPTSGNETIRFTSNTVGTGSGASNGGYFDIQLADNLGQTVGASSTSDANTYAQHLNAAFSSLNFGQERQISSYSGTQSITVNNVLEGSLLGSSVAANLPSYGANQLTNISVTAPTTGNPDAQIALTIDGNVYQTQAGLGNELGANQTYRLISTTNPSNYVDFTTGNSSISIANSADATALQSALSQAFGVSNGAGALEFQIGANASDTLAVSIGSAQTSSLYGGQTLDVSTQADATNASNVLTSAINTVTSLRATVGALESRFNFAAAALQSSVQNQTSAESQLLDTDIASESTSYATDQVKIQAGISVLAQANQQLQALLKLIG